MKSNNIPIVPQTYYEVQYLENEKIKLPGADEIKKNGLSDELREQLLNPNAKFENDLVVFMAQFWCTNCQRGVEHRAFYCHGRCGNDCEQSCSNCGRTTLTTTLASPSDSLEAAIRHATGEAQRRARDNGVTGEITVETMRFDANTGRFKTLILVYNTTLQRAVITKPTGW